MDSPFDLPVMVWFSKRTLGHAVPYSREGERIETSDLFGDPVQWNETYAPQCDEEAIMDLFQALRQYLIKVDGRAL